MVVAYAIPKAAWLVLALLLASAFVLRFTQLQEAPAGGHGDVSWIGINALDWVDRGIFPFYVRELYSPEFFPVYLTGILLPLTGISQLPQRIITATCGVLLVFALFKAAWWLLADFTDRRRLWGALSAAAAGALSIHVTFLSRLGMESPPFMLTVTLFVWATAWAWQRGGVWRWAVAGFVLGVNQYIYLPARLLPVVIMLWLGFGWLFQRRRLRDHWRGIVAAAVVSLVVTLPAIVLFLQTPVAFSARADAGGQETGGWVWLYDTSPYGGIVGLVVQKLWLTLKGVGISWNGEYTIMTQPMVPPLFFVGFIAAVLLTVRYAKRIAFAWCWLAIPPLMITDLISGGVPRVHALHQMGILPFVLLLSGIGLGFTLDWAAMRFRLRTRFVQSAALGILALAAVIPSAVVFARYLNEFTPELYRNPTFYWSKAQADLDMARYINSHRHQTYLLPISEYTRPDVAWFVASGFRVRESAIGADGQLNLPAALPDRITVVMPDDPERPRHDGHPAHFNLDQWVLLHDNTIYLLPMLDDAAQQTLSAALETGEATPLIDRSDTEIVRFVTIDRPDLFPASQVVQHPLDAVFNDTIRLVGYSANREDIEPGAFIDLTLYFQALAPVREDYDVFAQVWNDAKVSVAHTQEFPYSGMYRSRIWQQDEIVPVHLWLQVPDDLAYGRYTLVFGLYRYLHGERVPVTGSDAVFGDGIVIAPDLRYPLPPASADESETTRTAAFGDTLQFGLLSAAAGDTALDGDVWQVNAGTTLHLDALWQALSRPPQDYSVFLHLVAAEAQDQAPLAQSDALIRADYPTGAWRAGDRVMDTLTLAIPADLAPGDYDLIAGVYYWQTGERLPVSAESDPLTENRVRLARIHVSTP